MNYFSCFKSKIKILSCCCNYHLRLSPNHLSSTICLFTGTLAPPGGQQCMYASEKLKIVPPATDVRSVSVFTGCVNYFDVWRYRFRGDEKRNLPGVNRVRPDGNNFHSSLGGSSERPGNGEIRENIPDEKQDGFKC